jgi:hypothetical protein
MTYEEYRRQRESETSKLPLFWAFTDEQLETALKERNATIDDVCRIGDWNALCLKKDVQIIRDFVDKPDPIHELMKNHDFAVEAILFELKNYEYCYNPYQGDWDVITCLFGDVEFREYDGYEEYLKKLGREDCIPYYREAVREYYKWVNKNDIW